MKRVLTVMFNTYRWIAGLFMCLMALGSFAIGAILAAIGFVVLGLLMIPQIARQLTKVHIPLFRSGIAVAAVVVFMIGAVTAPVPPPTNRDSIDTKSAAQTDQKAAVLGAATSTPVDPGGAVKQADLASIPPRPSATASSKTLAPKTSAPQASPKTATPRPATITIKPTAATPRPVAVTPRPATATPKPVAVTPQPVAATPMPLTPAPVSQPASGAAAPAGAYYANCTAARNAGVAPIYRGQPGYRPGLDRDDDGIACEKG